MNDNECLARINAWRSGAMTAAQENEWLQDLTDPGTRVQVLRLMEELLMNASAPNENINRDRWQPVLNRILEADKSVQLASVKRMRPLQWIAAASVIILLGIGGYLWNIQQKKNRETVHVNPNPVKTDVAAPQTTRAVIVLGDGKQLGIYSAGTGAIASQGRITVRKNARGEIIYSGTDRIMLYNTLINPRGSKAINLTLSDGSRVWLNAESSLKYPVMFTGNTREVELTGEGYFEVTHNATKRFVVKSGNIATEVLGTKFNVKTYADEQPKITLLEGKVMVKESNKVASLAPSQQATWTNNSWQLNMNPDLEEVMAWKNERFQASGATMEEMMKQLSRYYDIDVQYEGSVSDKFGVNISRDVNLSQVLKMLELTGRVQFRIEGRTVYVKP